MKKAVAYNSISLLVIASVALIYFLKLGGESVITLAGDLGSITISFLCTLMLLGTTLSFKDWDSAKVTWLMLLLGSAVFCIAESIYSYLEVILKYNADALSPSVADIFYCGAYLFFVAGLLIFIIQYIRSGLPLGKWALYLVPAVILIAVITAAVYSTILQIIIADKETESLAKFIYMYYPLSDTVVIFCSMIVIYQTALLGKGRLSVPWRLLILGFIIMAIADIAYSYLDWRDLYQTGNLIDLLWLVSYWIIGLSGIYQKKIMESI